MISHSHPHGQWLEKFESEVLRLIPKLKGRVPAGAGEYFYLKGYSPRAAAQEWVNERNVLA